MSLQLTYKPAVGVQTVIICVSLPINQKVPSRARRIFSDTEYPEVTTNMVRPSSMPSRSKGKQLIVSSD